MSFFFYIIPFSLISLILLFIAYCVSVKKNLLRKLKLLEVDERLKVKFENFMRRKTKAIFLTKRLYENNGYFEKIIFENKSFDLNKGSIIF